MWNPQVLIVVHLNHCFVRMWLKGYHKLKYRISCSQMFSKIDALKIFAIFTGKHLRWSLFFINLQAFRCFPVFFWGLILFQVLFFQTPTQVFSCEYCVIFIEHLWCLFLWINKPSSLAETYLKPWQASVIEVIMIVNGF